MAITLSQPPIILPIPNDDRRLPTATWHARLNTVGDASGGALTAQIPLSSVGNVLYSFEDYGVSMVVGAAVRITWDTGVLGVAGFVLQLEMSHNNGPLIDGRAVLEGTKSRFPGIFQPRGGASGSVSAVKTNALAETDFQFNAWGYIWEPACLQLPGGPVRPGLMPQLTSERSFRGR